MTPQDVKTNDVLESVWNQFSCQLRAFIHARVRDEGTAEDILQVVFLRIHAKMETLRDMTNLESWIYQITTVARWRVVGLVLATRWVGAICFGFAFNILLGTGMV